MDNQSTEISSNSFLVCLCSDANFLALTILENLLAQKCYVNIVTDDVQDWTEKTKYIASKNRFLISEKLSLKSSLTYNYVVFCGGFINKNSAYVEFFKIQKIDKLVGVKTVAMFPYEIFDTVENSKIRIDGNLSVVYVGDLLGPRVDINSNLMVPILLNSALRSGEMYAPVGEVFHPLFITDAARTLTKWLFSFGPYGHEIFLLGPNVSASTFWQEVQNYLPTSVFINENKIRPKQLPRGYETKSLNTNIKESFRLTFDWLSNFKFEPIKKPKVKIKKVEESLKPVVVKKRIYPKIPTVYLIILIIIFTLPLIALTISSAFFYVGYKNVLSGKTDKTDKIILVAKTFSVITKKESYVLSCIPFFGRVYREIYFSSIVGESSANIFSNLLPIITSSSNVFNKVLGDRVYDLGQDTSVIKSNLDPLYSEISQLQVASIEESERGTFVAKKIVDKIDFEKFKKLSKEGQILVDNLDTLLGVSGQKTYLVLFQNNMELRPTGGFIGSYGLATFDGGRMSDLVVNDVYSADGQLNGHVEPPSPIKNYLGEANWFLRDSNWDPDFPNSAKRAEWFLDKEIGRSVDGVVSVDLFPIKKILEATGPIFLPDFNMSLDGSNLYEKTQSEVQDNFFPGTRKKESFLTALSRGLLSEVTKLDGKKKLLVLTALFDGFEQRHLQAYIHDMVLQKSLSGLLWDGSVVAPACGESCYADYLGLVEANLGVNKSNYFITRKMSLDVHSNSDEITRNLNINFNNSANPALGPSGRYKVYLRLIIPGDSSLVSVNSISQGTVEALVSETTEIKGRKEVGVLVEVLGGSNKDINFSWKTNVAGVPYNSYGVYFRKQAGVEGAPLSIYFDREGGEIKATPRFSLTREGRYSYNTTLTRDFFSRITWKQR